MLKAPAELQKRLTEPGHCQAEGWAWRGLAWTRLGEPMLAEQAFNRAESCGSQEGPFERSWDEWRDISLTYVLADRWADAFRAAATPKDRRARIIHQARIVVVWEVRHRKQTD